MWTLEWNCKMYGCGLLAWALGKPISIHATLRPSACCAYSAFLFLIKSLKPATSLLEEDVQNGGRPHVLRYNTNNTDRCMLRCGAKVRVQYVTYIFCGMKFVILRTPGLGLRKISSMHTALLPSAVSLPCSMPLKDLDLQPHRAAQNSEAAAYHLH